MSQIRLTKLSDRMRERQIDYALLSSLASLRYFAGFTGTIETGPSPFSTMHGALLFVPGEKPVLVVAGLESTDGIHEEIGIETFADYTFETPLNAATALATKLAGYIQKFPAGKIGFESDAFGAGIWKALREECPKLEWVDISGAAAELRMIKDEDEIATLRECCALCDRGQEIARARVHAGMTEIELFAKVREEIETEAGGRVALLADLISGSRTGSVGGPPSRRKMKSGDLVIVDLVPRHNGYWGDSCNTFAVGEATAEQRRCFEAIAEVLQQITDRVRPGTRACDLDAFARSRVERLGGVYPHHTGHGIGVTWHEEPRIVPYNQRSLEADMVIALEPGIYFPDRWGIRLEHVVRVTQDGAEVLSGFRHAL
jgi:Xaa-Pro dipeptidase